MKYIFITLSLIFITTCNAEDTKSFNELWDIAAKEENADYPCNASQKLLYHNEYKRLDKILNTVYKKALKRAEKAEKENLKKSQKYWEKYKKAECYAESHPYRDGTGEYTMVASCYVELTKERIQQLKEHFSPYK